MLNRNISHAASSRDYLDRISILSHGSVPVHDQDHKTMESHRRNLARYANSSANLVAAIGF